MLAPEGYSTIFIVFLFSALTAWGLSYMIEHWSIYLVYLALLFLCGLILFFFRDPERNPPGDDGFIIAPADGRVVQIKEVEERTFLNRKVTQISIFLSPLDVHVNRVPVTGKLEYLEYFPGKFLMAWQEHASEQNERAHFGVVHPTGRKFLFKQITGFMARRIVYHISEGDTLQAGQRFGIMKFGSRMDILIPLDLEIKVKEGDRTVAGESILGVIEP